MEIIKKILMVPVIIFVILLVVYKIYWFVNRHESIPTTIINDPDLRKKVLIASQGSEFKNALVDKLIGDLKDRSIYIKVVDVADLPEVSGEGWSNIVVIHTTEWYKAPKGVRKYLKQAEDLGNTVLVTTSGEGSWKPSGYDVDVITSASEMSDIDKVIREVMGKIDRPRR